MNNKQFQELTEEPRRVDTTTTPGVIYMGYADDGVATNQAFWRIDRIDTNGAEIVTTFATGRYNRQNIWDNRAALIYL